MVSVAEELQRARLEQGLELATVAAQTKINVKWLKAIEDGDRKSLPGGFFYKSFAHQYATFLGLKTEEIDAEIDRTLSADLPLPLVVKDNQARKLSRGSAPGMTYFSYAALVVLLAACTVLDGWWSKSHKGVPQKIATTAPVAKTTTPEPAGPEVSQVASSVAAPAGSAVRLDLTATEETWLSVSSDGTPVFTGLLAANQTKSIESEGDTQLRVGNAAGLEVRLNGKPLSPLGAHGQVRVLDFKPDKAQSVAPAPGA